MVKVKSMISTKGNAVPNQFILWNDEDIYFQSYKSIIARVQGYEGVYPVIVLDSNFWDYSKTTSTYLFKFLSRFGSSVNESINKRLVQKRIDNGDYLLGDLN